MKEQKLKSVTCRACGYQWQPRKEPSQIRECPNCKSRKWRGK